ncbi:MAG: hypothetical protein LBQ27_00285 [Clostridiales bacterium]|jgi:hypothetical protein|nr:hypothetical protein [Clostridiales bacterium]
MDEIEVLYRAKNYMDSLANGIDPISGKEMADDAVLNNVRLSRCFFYVSGVLDRIIKSGGEVRPKKKRTGLNEFALTEEQKSRVAISSEPISVTAFTALLNGVIDVNEYKKITYATIFNYLLGEGFLATQAEYGGEVKVPTEKGMALGIKRVKREHEGRTRYVNLCDENAQRYILEHINEM